MSKPFINSADSHPGLERQKAHEAIELAKLAVELCWLSKPEDPEKAKPEAWLPAALDLVHKASEVIKKSRE